MASAIGVSQHPDLFEAQDADYRESVLPAALPARVAVEAGVTRYWRPLVGDRGRIIGLDHFGASAPAEELFKEFGLTVEAVAEATKALV